MNEFLPENDGLDHINVYSKGRTELGTFLSNFAYSPIKTEDGYFNSIEGYWYWLSCSHTDRDILRKLHGFEAKKKGRELRGKDWETSLVFKDKVKKAIEIKVRSNDVIKQKFVESSLPLTHYYVFYGKTKVPEGSEWIMEFLEELRETLKKEMLPKTQTVLKRSL